MKIEGRNAVEELLKSDKGVDKVLIQNGLRDRDSRQVLALARENRVKVQFADKSALDRESVTGRHQGFIAYTEDYAYADYEDIISNCGEDAILLVLNEIVDQHNLGSIIRVSECSGVKGVFIGKNRCAQVTENVIRISEGSANHVKIAKVTNINTLIENLKKDGFWVYGLEVGGQDIYKTNLKGKIALVIGGEDAGVGKLTKSKCDGLIEIPLAGKVNSLNASVACGIAVFEAVRQRRT